MQTVCSVSIHRFNFFFHYQPPSSVVLQESKELCNHDCLCGVQYVYTCVCNVNKYLAKCNLNLNFTFGIFTSLLLSPHNLGTLVLPCLEWTGYRLTLRTLYNRTPLINDRSSHCSTPQCLERVSRLGFWSSRIIQNFGIRISLGAYWRVTSLDQLPCKDPDKYPFQFRGLWVGFLGSALIPILKALSGYVQIYIAWWVQNTKIKPHTKLE